MTDDNPVAEVGQFVPRLRLQQRQQRRRDLSFLQHEIFKLLRVRHPPDAVMLLYQLIAGAHVGGGHLFLRREAVFDHLKHPVKPRQGKHQHHHPANARRLNKLLIAASDVVQIFTIAFGFSVLLAANRHIQLGRGFPRQDLAQPFHQGAGQWRINHKIGTREAKHDARFGMGGQAGIDKQLALVAAMDRQQKGQRGHRHHQFAHQPGGFITIEQLIGDLQMTGGEQFLPQRLLQTGNDIADIPRFILPRQPQRQIGQHFTQQVRPAAIGKKIFRQRSRKGAKRTLGLRAENKEPLGGQRAVVKQAAVDRIEKALGNFKTRVIRQQTGVVGFHPQQKVGIRALSFRDAAQLLHHQTHMVVIEVDPLFHRLLHRMPVGLFKALLRAGSHFEKTPILSVKSLQYRLGNQ